MIRTASADDAAAWQGLRAQPWPLTPAGAHRGEIARQRADPSRFAAMLAVDARGCRALASDAPADNAAGHGFHHAIGFTPTERVVFHRKELK
jgi:hypothetical protein